MRRRSQQLLAVRARRGAAALDQAVSAAQSEIDQAASAGTALDRTRRETLGVQTFQQNPGFEEERQRALTDLEAARSLLDEGRRQQAPDRVVAAQDRARQARIELDDLSRRVRRRMNEIQRPDASGPPAELVASARAYFSGDYRKALNILQGTEYSDRRSSLQAHLFRAAAQYALFLTGGSGDPQLLDEARRDIRECRRLDADFVPDNRAFTPRFITFFQQGP